LSLPVPLVESAPAKVNLTLRVLGRRGDGYHEIESLVAFADFGDRLSFSRGGNLSLTTRGPSAAQAGPGEDNLVLKAARALAARPDIALGAFRLDKRLPVGAGLGGGSADAGAALRLIARANGLARDDPLLFTAARATGADVPVCLDPRARIMRGVGEVLSSPLALPPLAAVLVNPAVTLATKAVFAAWRPAAAGRPRRGGETDDPRSALALSQRAIERSGSCGNLPGAGHRGRPDCVARTSGM
jgi:4-diphosphocytidyl-2-C-methyl-D-erythritol kinase